MLIYLHVPFCLFIFIFCGYRTRDVSPVPQRPITADSLTSIVMLDPFVIGRLRPNLIFGAESIQQVCILIQFYFINKLYHKLSMDFHLYFGDSKIQTTGANKIAPPPPPTTENNK